MALHPERPTHMGEDSPRPTLHTPCSTPHATMRARAAAVLGLPEDPDAPAAVKAFLAALPGSEWAPGGNTVASLNCVADMALPAGLAASSLRDEVEEFASRYWSLSPSERLAAWLTLSTRSPDDPTAERLAALQAGLALLTEPLPDPNAEQIAALTRELYLTPPRERAIRRNEWLLANARRHGIMALAAVEARKWQPALTSLEPILFEQLTARFDAATFAAAAKAPTLPAVPYGAPSPTPLPTPPSPPPPPIVEPRRIPSPPPRSSDGKAAMWAIVIGASVLIKVFVGLSHSSPNNAPSYSPPRYTPPAYSPNADLNKLKRQNEILNNDILNRDAERLREAIEMSKKLLERSKGSDWLKGVGSVDANPTIPKPDDTEIAPAPAPREK